MAEKGPNDAEHWRRSSARQVPQESLPPSPRGLRSKLHMGPHAGCRKSAVLLDQAAAQHDDSSSAGSAQELIQSMVDEARRQQRKSVCERLALH